MSKRDQHIREFYEHAWHLVELMKEGRKDEWNSGLHRLYEIMAQLPDKVENADQRDIDVFFVGLVGYTHKSIQDIGREDLKNAINDRVFGDPKQFDFSGWEIYIISLRATRLAQGRYILLTNCLLSFKNTVVAIGKISMTWTA